MHERSLSRLPVEIWERIFHFTCLSSRGRRVSLEIERRYSKLAVVMTPLTLTHVCPRWRYIVTRSSGLWTSITVELSAGYPQGGTKLVKAFLEKSMPRPLNLEIHLADNH
ncbi:hypothetical protein L218DRAFT_1080464, partial [Marasmius fiardii PR-910]